MRAGRKSLVTALAAVPFFTPDVLPILQKHCNGCHRPGGIAPMSFTTFPETRPYARAIREAIVTRRMPPWFADAPAGEFANDPRLTAGQIDIIRRWVSGGSQEGSGNAMVPADLAQPAPDLVVQMPEAFPIPASGEVDYQHIIVPTGFTEDRWISAISVVPSAVAHVHHAVVFVRPPRSVWLRNRPTNQPFTAKGDQLRGLSTIDEVIGTYLPGARPEVFPSGHAKLIPAGSDLIFQVHYTTNGRAAEDRTRAEIIFARSAPTHRIYGLAIANGDIRIPPMASAYPASAVFTVHAAATLYSLAPHMHLRGKSMRVRLVNAEGDRERTILNVPKYDFHWQIVYRPRRPIAIDPGSRLVVDAVYDNSPNNKRNPDPRATVTWGEQSHEEMLVCFADFILPVGVSPNLLFRSL